MRATALEASRILVTGGAGYIGSALVTELLALSDVERVVSLDRRHSQPPLQPPDRHDRPDRLVVIDRDVREPLAAVIAENRIDTVIHLAFLLETQRDEKYAHSVNVGATRTLLEAAAKTGLRRFIYLSSTTVYGARTRNDGPSDESAPLRPTPGFQYSQHKAEAERLITRFASEHPDTGVTVLRVCPVMSPGASNFISDSLGMRYLPVPMGHDPDLQFVHLDDLLAAFVRLLQAPVATGIFNIAGAGTVRWSELVRITGATRIPVPLMLLRSVISLSWALRLQSKSPAPGLELITYPWLASTEKAARTLDWDPAFTTCQTIETWITAR